MLSTTLPSNKEHGGVTGECQTPSKRILFIFSRISGGISTKDDIICRI